jgi:hypothetical protein
MGIDNDPATTNDSILPSAVFKGTFRRLIRPNGKFVAKFKKTKPEFVWLSRSIMEQSQRLETNSAVAGHPEFAISSTGTLPPWPLADQ